MPLWYLGYVDLKQRNAQGRQISRSKQLTDEKAISGKTTHTKNWIIKIIKTPNTIFLINVTVQENIYSVLKWLPYQIDVSIILFNDICMLR